MTHAFRPTDAVAIRQTRIAMGLSLAVGFLMLAGKWVAYLWTGSAAIFSDAIESVVHVVAVGFAAYSLWLSVRPAEPRYPYGFEKITYFSAGFEGALIVLAAIVIVYESIQRWIGGLELTNLGAGTLLVAGAALVNAALGLFLIWRGRKHRSLILEANGQHVLTDSWTSFGVVGGLGLVLWTGWKPFDPILAIAVALNILWTGRGLLKKSYSGLMDEADPELAATLRATLERVARELGVEYHGVRFRSSGVSLWVELHVLFPAGTLLKDAHAQATRLEEELKRELPVSAEVTTHLETADDHAVVHPTRHYEGKL